MPGRRWSRIGEICVAPASIAAVTTSRSWSGASVIPGRIGATSTEHGTPASFSAATASRRARGMRRPGLRPAPRLLVHGADRERRADVGDLAGAHQELQVTQDQRSLGEDREGLRRSVRTSMIRGINRYRPSARWYGSVAVPIAMCSPFHRGAASSRRNTSGAFTLTTIFVSKSRPASMSRYVCVERAKQ